MRKENQVRTVFLNEQEARVLALLCDGYRPKEIAEQTEYTRNTVNTMIKRIYVQTGIRGQVPLVVAVLKGRINIETLQKGVARR